MCGADGRLVDGSAAQFGSPPRVRSRRSPAVSRPGRRGITSACAEQTGGSSAVSPGARDHLRVCGADRYPSPGSRNVAGSPPRVRSRPAGYAGAVSGDGITSACAEQTTTIRANDRGYEDHLRVCGADFTLMWATVMFAGSPPRVRSRLIVHVLMTVYAGITSACAEQTSGTSRAWVARGDHLRVCGADLCSFRSLCTGLGSPPRVRSRQCAAVGR